MPQASGPSTWTKGDRKAHRELERSLNSDGDDHITRFALMRLLVIKGDCVAAEELLCGPGIEQQLLADPDSRILMLSSLGGAYLMLWRARWEAPSNNASDRRGDDRRSSDMLEYSSSNSIGSTTRLDVSAERTHLLRQAQRLLEEALTAPENLNDPVIRAQVGFCKEARGDIAEALSLYASIISDSTLSPGYSAVIFRTSVLLAHVGRYDECVRYLEFIQGDPPKACSRVLVEALLYTCYVAMGLQMKASRRVLTLRDAFNDEYAAGRMGVGFSREEIPWDRLPGWFHLWRELGAQSLRAGDYYLGVRMLSQATLHKEDAETLVCTGEMLWVLGNKKSALQVCERGYAADPLHAGAKLRLAGWAPEKWKDRIAKEEDRREAVAEMRRLAELSSRKANAMIARRARRERARVLRAWRRFHAKVKGRTVAARNMGRGGKYETRGKGAEIVSIAGQKRGNTSHRDRGVDPTNSEDNGSASDSGRGDSPPSSTGSAGSASSSGAGSSSSTGSGGSSSSSWSVSSLSAEHAVGESGHDHHHTDRSAVRHAGEHPPPTPTAWGTDTRQPFPVPSAAEAEKAGRANAAACIKEDIERVKHAQMRKGRRTKESGGAVGRPGTYPVMAPLSAASKMVREAICGGTGGQGYGTVAMRVLARFEWERRSHEAKNTRAVYGV